MRWIDLGCPIDLDLRPGPTRGRRLRLDARRPAADPDADLAPRGSEPAADPHPGRHVRLRRARSGQLPGRRDFPVDGVAAGQNLASRFRPISRGVWELKLDAPLTVASGKLTVSVKDRQGNESRIERTFSAGRDDTRREFTIGLRATHEPEAQARRPAESSLTLRVRALPSLARIIRTRSVRSRYVGFPLAGASG